MDAIRPGAVLVRWKGGDLIGGQAEVPPGGTGPDDLASNQVPVPHEVLGGERGELEPLPGSSDLLPGGGGTTLMTPSLRRRGQSGLHAFGGGWSARSLGGATAIGGGCPLAEVLVCEPLRVGKVIWLTDGRGPRNH